MSVKDAIGEIIDGFSFIAIYAGIVHGDAMPAIVYAVGAIAWIMHGRHNAPPAPPVLRKWQVRCIRPLSAWAAPSWLGAPQADRRWDAADSAGAVWQLINSTTGVLDEGAIAAILASAGEVVFEVTDDQGVREVITATLNVSTSTSIDVTSAWAVPAVDGWATAK